MTFQIAYFQEEMEPSLKLFSSLSVIKHQFLLTTIASNPKGLLRLEKNVEPGSINQSFLVDDGFREDVPQHFQGNNRNFLLKRFSLEEDIK